jgi:conjugal transfer mating pair stabilization protein TraG
LGSSLNRLDQISRSVAERTGVSQAQVAQIAFGAGASLGLSMGGSGARLQAEAGKRYQAGLSSEEQRVLGAMTSEQLAEFKQFGERVSRDSSLTRLITSDAREARELASRLSSVTAQAERAESSYAQRRSMAERLSSARERGEAITIDLAQDPHNLAMFLRYAEAYGGDSAAAQALMDAELARRALPPTRRFSDGSAVAQSFEAIPSPNIGEKVPSGTAAPFDITHRANSAAVTGWKSHSNPPAGTGGTRGIDAHGVHKQVQEGSGGLRRQVEKRLKRQPDQTSLLKDVGRSVLTDAEAAAHTVGDVAKGVFDHVRK